MDTSEDTLQESRDLVAKLRQERAKLGDTSVTSIKRTRLPRISAKKPSVILLVYTFVLGLLFFPCFNGEFATFAAFVFVLVAWLYTLLKE